MDIAVALEPEVTAYAVNKSANGRRQPEIGQLGFLVENNDPFLEQVLGILLRSVGHYHQLADFGVMPIDAGQGLRAVASPD